MNEAELDADSYPTEGTLKALREWGVQGHADCKAILEWIRPVWAYAHAGYFAVDEEYNGEIPVLVYRLSTAGWSGNESLIDALQDNKFFWFRCWLSHKRGGHYEFEIRP